MRFSRLSVVLGDLWPWTILEEQFPVPRNTAANKIGKSVSFRCYDNSDVIVTVIITNFHLYLIQRWRQSFQIFVNSDVVYAQTRDVLTLKNSMESPKFPSPASHENSWPQWSAVYANLIKSRCTLGQILIMCLNYLLKNCIFYKKSL